MKRKLVDYLVNTGIVERKDIQRCVLRASMNNGAVVDEMVERLEFDQEELAEQMAQYWGLDYWDSTSFVVEKSALQVIPQKMAFRYGVLPVGNDQEAFTIAVYDVDKARPVIEKIRDKTGVPPTLVLAARMAIEEQISLQYGGQGSSPGDDEQKQSGSSAPSQGVMRKKKSKKKEKKSSRRSRPKRTTRSSSDTGARASTRPGAKSEDATPTRQVDIGADNPFMDLVDKTAKPAAKKSKSSAEEPPTRAIHDEPSDFFGDFESDVEEISEAEELVEASSSVIEEVGDDFEDELAGALDEFDAELESEAEIEAQSEAARGEPELLSSSSSVNWGEFDGEKSARPATGSGSRPDGAALSSGRGSDQVTEESGIFPMERSSGRFFDFPDDEEDDALTLAEVVDRQRRIIKKLEREIDYQKGILQTMAELLVESRVLSKRKLKSRLRAFKEAQREKKDR